MDTITSSDLPTGSLLFRKGSQSLDSDDLEVGGGQDSHVGFHGHPRSALGCATRALALLLTVLLLIGALLTLLAPVPEQLLAPGYLIGDTSIAQVQVKQTREPHIMNVTLMLYDQVGHRTFNQTFLVGGDEFNLQGDIVTYSPALTRLGFRSGYRITSYEGWYIDNRTGRPTPTPLKGEQGRVFIIAPEQTWSSPFAQAGHDNGVLVPADGKTYNVFLTQNWLSIRPV